MTEDRTKRRYNSTRRQAQARETRRQILEAARHLFTTRGYAGTTVETLAHEVGVAVETVYATFRSKRTVLPCLVDLAVGGTTNRSRSWIGQGRSARGQSRISSSRSGCSHTTCARSWGESGRSLR